MPTLPSTAIRARLRRLGITLTWTSSIVVTFVSMASPAAAGGYTVTHGATFGRPAGQTLVADVYVPDGAGPFPGVVVIHGGVFVKGDKSQFAAASQELASNGYVAFDINYRLAPRFPFPASVNDAQAAVVYLRAHAATYHVDPGRVGALGGSAGGNLVGMLATLGEGCPTGSRIVAGVTWSGVFDLTSAIGSHVIKDYVGASASTAQIQAASPVYQVDPTDAPLMIANGTNEGIPVSQAQAMADAYQKAAIPHELLIRPEQKHSEHLGALIYPQTIAFLDTHLKDYKGNCKDPTPTPTGSPSTGPSPSGGGSQASGGSHGTGSTFPIVPIVAIAGIAALLGALISWLVYRARTAVYRR
jgi:acetyl esterase/lipase